MSMPPLHDPDLSPGESRVLNALVKQIRDQPKPVDWWVRIAPFASVLVAAVLGVLTYNVNEGGKATKATADLANANAAAVIQINKDLINIRSDIKDARQSEQAELKAVGVRLDVGKDERLRSEKEQGEKIGRISELQAAFVAEIREKLSNQTQLIDRLIRKFEEVRRENQGPFDQGLRQPLTGDFPFVLRASGTVLNLRRTDL